MKNTLISIGTAADIGGPTRILALCGKNGTSIFAAQRSGQSAPENILASFQIGVLKKRNLCVGHCRIRS